MRSSEDCLKLQGFFYNLAGIEIAKEVEGQWDWTEH